MFATAGAARISPSDKYRSGRTVDVAGLSGIKQADGKLPYEGP